MATTRTRRVELLFQEAYELSDDDRAAFLERRCGDEPDLRREVEELLNHEQSAPQAFLSGQRPASSTLEAGQRVGYFVVVRRIGEGGMGTVYEAEQEHPRRTVALKLVRAEWDDPEILGRFRREADLLAALHHPGIAQIFEAGMVTLDGVEQPYLAMECVRGESLAASARGLDLNGRVELAARICDAAWHAHQRGVIHRDLKPDNILVVPGARGVGQPKILDFGIARAIGPGLQGRTFETRAGHLVGTLEYMSPEQVRGDRTHIDTRSDVYALGVVLYELLVGRAPIDLANVPLPECARRICEERATPAREVHAGIPAELDAICAMALEKDAEDRYPSARDLGADLRRYLGGEPVVARSHSTLYVLRKSLRRHRGAAAITGLLVGLLIAFGIVATGQASRNRRLAERLAAELRAGNIERGRALSRSDNLVAAEDFLWREHLADPTSPHSYWALWELYSRHLSLGSWEGLAGHGAAAFHPSGELFATGGEEGQVRLWDADGRGLRRLIEVGAPVRSLDFRGLDGLLAVATAGGHVQLWRVDASALALDVEAHDRQALVARFAPDGRTLASGGQDGEVRLWDPIAGTLVGEPRGHTGDVMALAFSPDGALLASGGGDGAIHISDPSSGATLRRLLGFDGTVLSLAFSPDGRTLASGGTDKLVHLWDTDSGRELDVLGAPNGSVRYLAWSPTTGELVAGGWWSVLSWDVATHARTVLAPSGLWDGALGAQGTRLATASERGLHLWDLTPQDALRLGDHAGRVVTALRPDGALLVTGDEEGTLRTWDARTGQLIARHALHGARIRALAFAPDGASVLVGSLTGELAVVDPRSGEERLRVDDHQDLTVASAAFGPRAQRLAHTASPNRVKLYDIDSRVLLREWEACADEVLGVAFSPDGRLATTGRDDRVRLWSPEGEPLGSLPAPREPWRPVFSDDGRRLAVTAWAPAIYVYDAASGRLEATLEGHRAVVWDAAFTPGDSDTLASASDDGSVRLWDVPTGRCLLTLDDFGGWDVFSVSFGPEDVLAAGGRQAAILWDLRYYARHVAANAARRLALEGETVEREALRTLETWVASELARPWPRFPGDGGR